MANRNSDIDDEMLDPAEDDVIGRADENEDADEFGEEADEEDEVEDEEDMES